MSYREGEGGASTYAQIPPLAPTEEPESSNRVQFLKSALTDRNKLP